MSDMTRQEAERLRTYGKHKRDCAYYGQYAMGDDSLCDCGFRKLLVEASDTLEELALQAAAATPPEQPASDAPKARHGFLDESQEARLAEDQAAWIEKGKDRHIHADSSTGGLDDAPEAVTEADVWGRERDTIEMLRGQLRECRANRDRVCVDLRAEVGTVTSNHEQVLTALAVARDMMNESADDLAAEREAKNGALRALAVASDMLHEVSEELEAEREAYATALNEYNSLLETNSDTFDATLSLGLKLKKAREYADGLVRVVHESQERRHRERSHHGDPLECEVNECADMLLIRAAHDARREKGAGQGGVRIWD